MLRKVALLLLTVLLGLVSYTQRLQFPSAVTAGPEKHQAERTSITIDQSTAVLAPLPKAAPRKIKPPTRWTTPAPPVVAEPADYMHPERQLITL